jgi:hypothetical protein
MFGAHRRADRERGAHGVWLLRKIVRHARVIKKFTQLSVSSRIGAKTGETR